jgi:hypothetical protein
MATSASFSHSPGSGLVVVKRTVWSSIASTMAMPPTCFSKSDASASARLMLNTTSAAVNGVPSWKVTPGRSSNSHVVGFKGFQVRASCGTIDRLESTSSRAS